MARPPTAAELAEQLRDLMIESRTTLERLQTLKRDAEEQKEVSDKQREDIALLKQESALLRQRLDDHLKRVETWEGRRWGIIVGFGTLFVGAILSLASGLIVTLVKK